MNGLELAQAFYNNTKGQLFAGELAPYADRMAAGLVGEGSECLGFDDVTSRDHDWGPGYCIWLDPADYREVGEKLQARYDAISAEGFAGFPPRPEMAPGTGPRRVGVFSVDYFYQWLLRSPKLPDTLDDWRELDESALATATNGKVFEDTSGRFTSIRNRLLKYYPEDIRLKKIARGCMLAAQAGQYNFPRQAKRNEHVSSMLCLSRFSTAIMEIAYALERKYLIYYKWTEHGLLDLGDFGTALHSALQKVVWRYRKEDDRAATAAIEGVCIMIADELRSRGLSKSPDPFLIAQAIQVNSKISDEKYRNSDLMKV